MTCRDQEGRLSLYVEGDLPDRDAVVLEAHLEACGSCRSFLGELRASQGTLKALAAEPLDEDALAAVRLRVRSPNRQRPSHTSALYWGMAASLIAAIGGFAWLRGREARPPGPPLVPAMPSTSVTSATPPVGGTPVRTPRRVFPIMDVPTPAPTLSREDADQLARAVVAVSQIESVEDVAAPSPAPSDRPPLIRLATSDPDIVIYWQLESEGGK